MLDNYKGNSFKVPKECAENFTNHIQDINEDRDLVDMFQDSHANDWISKKQISILISKNMIATKNFMKEYFPMSKYDKNKMIDGEKGCYNKIMKKAESV